MTTLDRPGAQPTRDLSPVVASSAAAPGKPEVGPAEEYAWDQPDLSRPPSLAYDWRARRVSFGVSVLLMFLLNVLVPNIIFYALLHHNDTERIAHGDNSVLYGATTATLGTLQIPQWFWRWWDCHRKNTAFITAKHDPDEGIWAKAWCCTKRSIQCWDLFQWAFLGGIVTGATTLILGTCLDGNYGNWPLMALSPPIIFAFIGLALVSFNILSAWGVRTSSHVLSRGYHQPLRPGLAYVWADLTAVDGGGRQAFRDAFDARWHASPQFRSMIMVLSWGVGLPLILLMGPEVALVVVVKNHGTDFVQVVGSTWASVWALLVFVLLCQTAWAYFYVNAAFERERQWWRSHHRAALVS